MLYFGRKNTNSDLKQTFLQSTAEQNYKKLTQKQKHQTTTKHMYERSSNLLVLPISPHQQRRTNIPSCSTFTFFASCCWSFITRTCVFFFLVFLFIFFVVDMSIRDHLQHDRPTVSRIFVHLQRDFMNE